MLAEMQKGNFQASLSGWSGRIDPDGIALVEGSPLAIELGDFAGTRDRVACAAEAFFAAARPDQRVLVDDGRIELTIVATAPGRVDTRVTGGGTLSSGKGLSLPGVPLLALVCRQAGSTSPSHDQRAIVMPSGTWSLEPWKALIRECVAQAK